METENSLLKTEILDMMKKNQVYLIKIKDINLNFQDIVNENNEKVSEIEKLKSQIKKETNDSKAQIILDDKSYLFSMNSLGNSTKHSEELNKLKRFLADLKYENNILKEENNILKIENKKACELIIQQKSQKIIKTFENKVDLIKFTNNQENVAQPEKKMKNNRVALNKFELNEELKLEKTKKFRFVKPKY